MSYLKSLHIETFKTNPFPYNVPSIKNANNIDLSNPITFFIGDNGSGKSTLLETLAFRLQLPHMDNTGYGRKTFQAARTLVGHLELEWDIERSVGFFFRAEDFGNLLNSVQRRDFELHADLKDLKGDVPDHIIQEMKDSANYQLHNMRRDYGQELEGFSHGEAYLHIMQQRINQRGIYILDEPEAALSPSKQLTLLSFIQQHLNEHMSQFIIATHSPVLMSYPGAQIYEITENSMQKTNLEDTEHYSVTKSFLNNPQNFLRFL